MLSTRLPLLAHVPVGIKCRVHSSHTAERAVSVSVEHTELPVEVMYVPGGRALGPFWRVNAACGLFFVHHVRLYNAVSEHDAFMCASTCSCKDVSCKPAAPELSPFSCTCLMP